VLGDDPEIGDVGAVDEECARDRVMEGCRGFIAGASAHEFAGLQRETRVDVAARRLDRHADLMRERAQATLDRRPLRIAKGLRCALQRRIGVQLEREPSRRYAELLCCLFDPDRAEVAKRSNDVGPDQQSTRTAHDVFPSLPCILCR